MRESPDTDIEDMTSDPEARAGALRVAVSLHPDAAAALEDLLTVGRGRARGQALSPVERALRRALRRGLGALRQ